MPTPELQDAIETGMLIAYHAQRQPLASAVVSDYGERTFAELNDNANRLARLLADNGIVAGDSVAIVLRNRPEFIEALAATTRTGIRLTPINFHLKAEEIGYIVANCDAKALIADASLGQSATNAVTNVPALVLKLAAGGKLDGFDDYTSAISACEASNIAAPCVGSRMLYTSGTTGQPKGVFRKDRVPEAPQWEGTRSNYQRGEDRQLVTGPAYHAAPLLMDVVLPLSSGIGIVMMDKWDAEDTLCLIDRYKITHTHMVATMFHRLLQLPQATKDKFDISSLRVLVHGAAPCPVHIKQSMIDWFGPIIWEYYAATEGGGGFAIGSEEWLTKPGTVGKPSPEFDNKIIKDDGTEAAPDEIGTIYMKAPQVGRFEYYKDDDKTGKSYLGDHFTLGDLGYFDEDGYLFLTGRSAELIISGGVNIYPQEVDTEIMKHPAVLDVCTVGVPNTEWGEEVKTVVQLQPDIQPDAALTDELMAWAQQRLANFKCPRSIDYIAEIPRSAAGKVQRRTVRTAYWDD